MGSEEVKRFIVTALLLALVTWSWREKSIETKKVEPSLKGHFAAATSGQRFKPALKNVPSSTAPVITSPTLISSYEPRTIEAFSDVFKSSLEVSSPAALIRDLQRVGLAPNAARDFDPATGSMVVVETKNALPGSRYFRAQYASDEQGVYQLQHMSFELKPGTPIEDVIVQLNRSVGPLPSTSYADTQWKAWKLPGHYTLSIQKLNAEDVSETALHAYSRSDIGTLRVALEADLPGHDHEPL